MNIEQLPTPMTLREAVEAAKIITPHVAVLRQAPDGLGLVHRLFDCLLGDDPAQPFRLLSLAYHTTLEDVAASLSDKHPAAVIMALANGMRANPIPDLVNFARLIGLTSEAWDA